MAVSKKRNYARKSPKIYQFTRFETELFEDEFNFPNFTHMPIRVIEALNTGELQLVSAWLREAGVEEAAVEAFRDLDQNEIQDFIAAWNSGQPIDLGKS